MLIEFDFAVTQAAYVKAAMDEIPTFRPDGATPTGAQTLIDSATPVRAAYVTKTSNLEAARALRRTSIETLHDHCVDFTAQARSRYRTDKAITQRIVRLPTDDQTFQQTLTRAAYSEALWNTLPQVGAPPAAFTLKRGNLTVIKADFTTLIANARSADGAIPAADQDFQAAEADLHAKQEALLDFNTAALSEGRSQFDPGTPEREIIDAIPTAPNGSAGGNGGGGGGGGTPDPTVPGPASISSVTGDGTTTVLLQYGATGADTFDIFVQEPATNDYVLRAGAIPDHQYVFTGVSGAPWLVYVVGKNAVGDGTASAPVNFSGPI